MTSNDTLPIALTVGEWNQVLAILSEQPFRVVAPLIGKIHGQAMTALGAPPGAANGAVLPAPPQGGSDGLAN